MVPALWRSSLALLIFSAGVNAQTYSAPAGIRPPVRKGGASILPGGRVVAPFGDEYAIGPGAFAMALSPTGKSLATANGGPWVYSVSILDRLRTGRFENRQVVASGNPGTAADWKSVSNGIAFASERGIYVSEGNSGRISYLDSSDERRRAFDLNQNGFHDSYSGDLAFDPERNVLYAVDQANFRIAVFDAKSRQGQMLASLRVGRLPFALALSPDRRKLYVTNLGMLEYRAIPGADPGKPLTGLPFPPYGFPGKESAEGVQGLTGQGSVQVPGLGDPNAPESNSLCVIDVADPAHPKVEAFVRTGLPVGETVAGGSSPSAVLAASDAVFVANAGQDSITVVDPATHKIQAEIPIRIPGLETLRGVLPLGMAYDPASAWLLVAEAGINAVGIIDVRAGKVLGHVPAAWFPTRVLLDRGLVFVANARGHGVGPNVAAWSAGGPPPYTQLYQGSLSVFPLPKPADLPAHTALVMAANGFQPSAAAPAPIPGAIRHVVLIVKESRSFDEVLGDIPAPPGGSVMGAPSLARLGSSGYVDGRRERVSIRDADITPNHHAIARQWAFSDNFYADSEGTVDGHHWLAGVYPNAWTYTSLLAALGGHKDFRLGDAPGRLSFAGASASVLPEDQSEPGTLWRHLALHRVSFRSFGEGFEFPGVAQSSRLEPSGARLFTNAPLPAELLPRTSRAYPGFNIHISDQYRVSQFIKEVEESYLKPKVELPQFIYIHLPNDYLAAAQPGEGYPYEESFMTDNDYALGRLMEFLSGTPWWREMAVFVTEDDAAGGVDHIDAHRTLLLCAGPWAKPGYVSHRNVSFPGLLKTVFHLLRVPPLNLFDAAASDLSDCFAVKPADDRFHTIIPDKRIYDPSSMSIATPNN